MTTLRAGSATDVGRIRSANEDSKLVVASSDLYVVADGMGGHQGGEVASSMAVELIEREAGEASLDNLMEAVRLANRAIFERAGNDPDLHGMGTTAVAIRVVPGPEGDEIAWVSVGDSRIYLLRDDSLIQLSRDHSLVEDLLRDGQLTEEEAAVHPQRNILTRALGIDLDVDVDGGSVMPFTGDRFLLCSDGLFNEVTTDQMTSVLRRLADPGEAADELVRLANEGGGRDNITVVVVDVVDDDGRAAAASAALAASQSGLESHAPDAPGAAGAVEADAPTQPAPDASNADAPPDVVDPTTVVAASTVAAAVPPPAPPAPPAPPSPQAFEGYRSSLPESQDDYGAESDDLFHDLDHASSRRWTWRVAAFLLALLVVVAVVVGAVIWSARNTYYVGFDGNRVAVYKGKPGGVLFLDPKLEDTTDITRDELPENLREVLDDGKELASKGAATRYLVYLRTVAREEETTTTTTTTTSTTTTTVAGATTRPAGPTTTTAPGGP